MKQIKTVKFKERRASKMNNTQYNMRELGYRFDEEALRSDHVKQMGFALPEDHADCYELISPFLVVAYQSGLNGESLTDLFPFIKESAPAATETQETQEPKPLNTCDNDIIPGAALQGENNVKRDVR